MLEEVIYVNRYKDNIKFEFVGEKTIKVTGYSPYFRYGYPNVYDKAYEKYVESARKDAELDWQWIMSQNDFEQSLFQVKDEDLCSTESILYKAFAKHIYSDMNTIDMLDPSGGPYLHSGTDMREFFYKSKFPNPLIIKEFKIKKNHVLIILK